MKWIELGRLPQAESQQPEEQYPEIQHPPIPRRRRSFWGPIVALGGMVALASLVGFEQFSKPVRKDILRRDRYTCQHCGRRYYPGGQRPDGKWLTEWMMHAAHIVHDHDSPMYDDMRNGRGLCVPCHLRETIELGQLGGAQLLARHVYIHSFHTWEYLRRHPEVLEQDRQMMYEILNEYECCSELTLDVFGPPEEQERYRAELALRSMEESEYAMATEEEFAYA